MVKKTKRWLIIAAVLVLIGCIIFAGGMMMVKWDFQQLSTSKFVTNSHEIKDAFHNISLKTDTADIEFAVSEDGICKVVCYEQTSAKHAVSVQDGTLNIHIQENKKWYEYVGINFDTPKITVYLPKTEYGAVTIENNTGDVKLSKDFLLESLDISTTTGNICSSASAAGAVKLNASTGAIYVENMMAQSLEISVSTGKVTVTGVGCEGDITVKVSTGKATLKDVVCKSVISSGSTGDITLENVIAADHFSLERNTGKVRFDRSDASEIFITTSTGDVTGSLLTDKIYIVDNNTGEVIVPKSTTGGKCEIITDTGDVILTIYKVDE